MSAKTSWCIKSERKACGLASSLVLRQFTFDVEHTPEGHRFSIPIHDDFTVHMKSVDEIERIIKALNKEKM